MATLKAAIIPVTPLQQNSCVIWKESSKIAAVTDPGGDLSLIENFISEQGLTLSKVFITHGHLDHAGGAFELAQKYKKEGMSAYSKIQEQEFAREKDGYTSVKHQREVGTSYFDAVSNTISSGKSSTTAMEGSTESEQF